MTKITEQSSTMSIKECSRCHITKSSNEFRRINEYLTKICKACQNELNKIRDNKNKSRIILEYFNGKCYKCDTDISMLPALDFHHLDTRSKTISYWKLKGRSYNIILTNLTNENVTVLCANCHILENATLFKTFKKFILDTNIYKNSPNDFERKVNNVIENHLNSKKSIPRNPKYKADIKHKIKIWIKKRFIIEQIYGGNCIGCRSISIQDNLPSFNFHHLLMDIKKKGNSWRDIRRLSVEEIVEILYQENCICLCANCHRMQHNINFKKNYKYILNKNLVEKTNLILKQIRNNIDNFKLKSLSLKNPFRKKFGTGEIWKKYILIIHNILKENKRSVIGTTELSEYMNKTRQITNRTLNVLLKENLIEIMQDTNWFKSGIEFRGRTPRKFKLTKKANSIISILLREHPEYQV